MVFPVNLTTKNAESHLRLQKAADNRMKPWFFYLNMIYKWLELVYFNIFLIGTVRLISNFGN